MSSQLPDYLERMKLFLNDRSCVMLTDNNTVFRYISAKFAEDTKTLYKSGLIDKLVGKKLLQPGTLHETGLSEYPLVIEHPFIQRLSYPFEWSALALKEVALAIIEIEEIANGYGYTLCDPGPFNLTIQNGCPVYLDYDSLILIEKTPIWNGYEGFRDVVLFPLQLYGKRLHYIARSVLRDIGHYDLDRSVRKLAGNKFQRNWLDRLVVALTRREEITDANSLQRFAISCINGILRNRLLRKILENANYMVRPIIEDNNTSGSTVGTNTYQLKALGSRSKFLKSLRKKAESLTVSTANVPPWEKPPEDSRTIKEKSFLEIVRNINPKTTLAIGDNTGWFSLALAQNGTSVISLNSDEESTNRLYSYVRSKHIPLLPLVMDIRQPTPGYETNIGTILAATQRFKSEFVMVFSVSNPLPNNWRVMVGDQIVVLDHLVYWLNMFSERYLLLEFVPADDIRKEAHSLTGKNWDVQVLKEAFGKCFAFKDCWDYHPQGHKLLLFQKAGTE